MEMRKIGKTDIQAAALNCYKIPINIYTYFMENMIYTLRR